ncbi:cystatin C (amyloid angiopathy and cerebral hemorrhage) [Plectropomus leopardus]|uniref:cystatin C (amyloid angiopathy and cerebral hemorrhage) n=1 Tax=Plectropomus leopardus TaxID=160734 RepID=UPI001C4B91C3|nr:cystatin C (amyloid angiopathy and cerebral hemorrhage) [Plectropomus leopardus]
MWKIILPLLATVFAVGSASLVGGFRDTDINNDQGAQEALNFSVIQHNRGTNDLYLRQVTEVVKVEKQMVAGIKYIITVKMARTSCRRDRINEECSVHQSPAQAQPYQCEFTVWSKPWENFITVLKENCQKENNTGNL